MRVAPVSADLLIKLALSAAVVGVVIYAVRQIKDTIGTATDYLPPASAFNPASDQNIIYQASNGVVAALTGTKDETFGGWLYSATHPDPMAPPSTYQALPSFFDAFKPTWDPTPGIY